MNPLVHVPVYNSVENASQLWGSVEIEEIGRRSRNGVLQPFYCRGTDGKHYFVKSRGATPYGLAAEWIVARLGQSLGLPVPPIRWVYISPELLDVSSYAGGYDLSAGWSFGSQEVRGAETILESESLLGDSIWKARVLCFDLWVRNVDRKRINPNLLWHRSHQRAYLIDHEKSLVSGWSPDIREALCQEHLFAETRIIARHQWETQWAEEFMAMAERVESFWSEVPEEWRKEMESGFSLDFLTNDPTIFGL
jgi:hypothetical protein